MKIFSKLNDLLIALQSNPDYHEILEDMLPVLRGLIPTSTLMNDLGGDVYILETLEDFKEIEVFDLDDPGKSLLDKAGIFDIVSFCDVDWIKILSLTSDSGGPVYYIPRELARLNPNVGASLELSNS
jgi:hypothetical protein